MSKTSAYRFVIESTQFAKLERALSVALSAARSLGIDAGIFWLRDSIFAATPYASIGTSGIGSIFDKSSCLAISQCAASKLLIVLRSSRTRRIEKINFAFNRNEVIFTFERDRDVASKELPLASRYSSSWRPRLTPREHYELLTAHRPYFKCEFSIEDLRAKLRSHEDYGYVVLEDFPNVISRVTVSRSLLLAFLEAAKDEDTTFQLAYYYDHRCVGCRAGDVIAILSVID